ncbi:MAG: hypothetical protein FWH08_05110 [Oscillospiraceae bacterium]|nr:hypothetical protein [Oscillospiraceae bacterium]
MLKFYTAFTREIDHPEAAVQEIVRQLEPARNALKNTVGIVHFCLDFATNETWKLLIAALPFELVGCLSACISINGEYSDCAVSVTMITSDDVCFSVRAIDNIHTKTAEETTGEFLKLFNEFSHGKKEKPAMVLQFMSSLPNFSSNDLYDAIRTVDDPCLIFGMCALNIGGKPGTNLVLADGKISSSMCAMVAFYGDINIKYHIDMSIIFDETYGEEAKITEAEGAVLKSVNDMPALEYFKQKGLISSGNEETGTGIAAVPAIMTYKNGTKVACSFLGVVEGTQHLFAARSLEDGAKIVFSYLDGEKTLRRAEVLMREICEDGQVDYAMIFSNVARAWSCSNIMAESQKIAGFAKTYKLLKGTPLRYSLAYAGGELGPVRDVEGNFINMPHNYSIIACSFKSSLISE